QRPRHAEHYTEGENTDRPAQPRHEARHRRSAGDRPGGVHRHVGPSRMQEHGRDETWPADAGGQGGRLKREAPPAVREGELQHVEERHRGGDQNGDDRGVEDAFRRRMGQSEPRTGRLRRSGAAPGVWQADLNNHDPEWPSGCLAAADLLQGEGVLNGTKLIAAAAALGAFAIPAAAAAQSAGSAGMGAYQAGYGGARYTTARPQTGSTRDENGNRLIVNGIIQSGASAYSSASGGVSSTWSGAGGRDGTAIGGSTAIGNSLNVVVQGDHNTVIVNSR